MNKIRIRDLTFEPFIHQEEIRDIVIGLAERIDRDYEGLDPVLLIVMNGAFIFAADLVRKIAVPLRLDFVKLQSYHGTESSGQITEDFCWKTSLQDQHVLIVEDIVDTGHTLEYLKKKIREEKPASIQTVCLLTKPEAYLYKDTIKYEGKAIPNVFVVGYGLDYDSGGRNLECIYKEATSGK